MVFLASFLTFFKVIFAHEVGKIILVGVTLAVAAMILAFVGSLAALTAF
jgi:hypothetical protein